MNRRLLILPVVGVVALGGSQLLSGGDTELPPEPVFPSIVGSPTSDDWTQDGWSVNRFVDDPFQPSLTEDVSDLGFEFSIPSPDADPQTVDPEAAEVAPDATPSPPSATPTPPPAVVATPASTTTTTVRDTSLAPPPAADGSSVDLPEIDDLPGPSDSGDGSVDR